MDFLLALVVVAVVLLAVMLVLALVASSGRLLFCKCAGEPGSLSAFALFEGDDPLGRELRSEGMFELIWG